MNSDRSRRLAAEAVGTAMLLAAIVGSGIMGERLAGGDRAVALLANSLATGAALVALILTFGPVSGAHLNPAVTLADASQGGLAWKMVPGYVCAQVIGAVGGVWTAHAMFGEPILMLSTHARQGRAQMFSEFVATFGLLAVILGWSRRTSRQPTGSLRPRPSRIRRSPWPGRSPRRSRASPRVTCPHS
jgi:glycerol uptake facilitator-like aquaporin